ncbi:MAG: DegT/DnrJ/EryC1/StrS family aminotransferase [Chloroflexi bacterium]|nr:DegT/DnrJ/EryC1/StrS family aminotransferase [Chloroflexota bacterium]
MRIPITKPFFGAEELRAIQIPLETGWVVQGPKVAEFERRFAKYSGASFALATTSCTSALHLAMVALGVGPGDEVIIPSFTWVATANVVEMQGARPVIVDIDLRDFNIAVDQIERAITARTKVIMPVSLFGVSAPMQPILEVARQHGLKVVEDAACATGAWYDGHHAGTLADIGCFSFHPRKAITTGEGGLLITQDAGIAKCVQSLRDHGASKSDLAWHESAHSYQLPDFDMVGYNYRMTDLQGSLDVAQMERLEWILEQRTKRAQRYDQFLKEIEWLRPQALPSNCKHGYQSYVCLLHTQTPTLLNWQRLHAQRNALMDALEAAGIATRPGTHAVHLLGFYREKYEIQPEDFPNALFADKLTLTLPLYAQMTDEEQDYVITHLLKNSPKI